MDNFVLHTPTKILFGKNTIPAIGRETVAFGKNVLLVYGRNSIKNSGIYQQVISSLTESGAQIHEHSGVQSNPVLSHVSEGVERCKRHRCDVICAVGGGSVLDEAKAISAGALVSHDVWKFLTGKKSIKNSLPVTTVPTLAASGSENNSGMVITHDVKRLKFGFANRHLFPKTSILDPETTFTVPPAYTAFGAIDALSHILEFYLTTLVSDSSVQDALMEGLLKNIMTNTDRCLIDPTDYDARANLMWSASLALNGIISAGLGKVMFPMHLIEHALTSLYGIPHGAGLAITIPGVMRYAVRTSPSRISKLGKNAFGIEAGTIEESAEATIDYLTHWFKRIGAPICLEDIGVGEDSIQHIAENALPQAKIWRMKDMSRKAIEEILHRCLRTEK
jgi:alcohol dehydrogenase YqhD (iron-dependent ADH family)